MTILLSKYQLDSIHRTLRLAFNAIKTPKKILKYTLDPLAALGILMEPFIDVKLRRKSSEEIIRQHISALHALGRIASINTTPTPIAEFLLDSFIVAQKSPDNAFKLKSLLDKFGSDKATVHNYYLIYQLILDELNQRATTPTKILEIGLGTNNLDVPSNMGSAGKPGASLRAFSVYFPSAVIHGADIDKRILFREGNIETFWVDQLSYDALSVFFRRNSDYDLIIDDGLHTAEANLQTLSLSMSSINLGGYVVVEDIGNTQDNIDYWNIAASFLSERFTCRLVHTEAALLFIAKRHK